MMQRLERVFVQGKMNQDVDERLLPNGQYRKATNIRVGNSEGSDVGAIENVLGNLQLINLNLVNGRSIGGTKDDVNEKIYWVVVSDTLEGIVEYDLKTNSSRYVLEDSPNNILRFNNGKRINNMDIVFADENIGNLLFWVQEGLPPRMINIERAKGYSRSGFIEDDISVIKKPPRFAPRVTLTFTDTSEENYFEDRFFKFAYRYKYLDEMYSAISFFSETPFLPSRSRINYDTLENEGMLNAFNAVEITINTGSERVVGVEILYKEDESNTVYIIESFDKALEGWGNNTEQSFVFANNKTYAALPSQELGRLFDNIPVEAMGQELLGNRIGYYNYYEGYELNDSGGQKIKMDYSLNIVSKDLSGNLIPVSTSAHTYGVGGSPTIQNAKIRYNLVGVQLKEKRVLAFEVKNEEDTNAASRFDDFFQFILNKNYANIPALVNSVEFTNFITTIWTNRFRLNYIDEDPPANSTVKSISDFVITEVDTTGFSVIAPYVIYEVDNTPLDPNDSDFSDVYSFWNFIQSSSRAFYGLSTVSPTVKTNRDYEIAVVYYDDANRSTTALTSKTNTVYVPHRLAEKQNQIEVTLNHKPPSWATKYKFVIKQNSFDYDVVYVNKFYEEGLFRWLKIEGANVNKVKEGDRLIIKSDLDGFVDELSKFRIIELVTKETDFIADNTDENDNAIIEEPGLYAKIKPVNVNINYNQNLFFQYDQGRKVSSGRPTVYMGFSQRTLVGYFDSATSKYVDYQIGAGSRILLRFRNYESDGYNELYERNFIAQNTYDNFQEWFDTEVGDLDGALFSFEFLRDIDFQVIFGTPIPIDSPNNALIMRVTGNETGTSTERSKLSCQIEISLAQGSVIFETEPDIIETPVFYETPDTFEIINNRHQGNVRNQTSSLPAVSELTFFNAFIQGSGVESYKIRDEFNQKKLGIDSRPSAVSTIEYTRVYRPVSITHSGVFSDSTTKNELNVFNLSLVNFIDLEKKYGSIQKLFFRDDNILVMQEDKLGQLLYQKDATFKEDGSFDLISVNNVFGAYIAYTGEYGISKNPESFAFFGNRVYCVDSKRGSPLRLSIDGVNEISVFGLNDFFKDLFRNNVYEIYQAAYNPYFDEYLLVITDGNEYMTIGFSEAQKGWTSFYSFVPELMISMNNHLYSFKNGDLYIHNSESVPRNNFYGTQYTSKVSLIFNEAAADDKIFKTLVTQSNSPWSATLKTNYTQSTITVDEYFKRESRYYAYTRRNEDVEDFTGLSANGIGNIANLISNQEIEFNEIPSYVSVGDNLYAIVGGVNALVGEVLSISDNIIGLAAPSIALLSVGLYCFATKNSRVESGSMRGYYLEVELENTDTEMAELFAVSTNTVKSYV
ncbi:hypothetical protein [Aquimarina algiphila]|uniref:Uncharacterized protein n=1 Tax=Aquimarina algiphila TaxID=2047982 RepID=A0A554VRI4_9FLAO|nr:hypothetical protein [Aquimarina algiphila]TSE11273.1 hypothetical protein FOF46_01195 [Aquimarina algiphila]